jgi:two-component system, OmpR family, alkaline phosphatase synthesis response regulator PhoP
MGGVPTKANVLVVDDEEDILELVRVNLTREGYQVQCALTGEAALALVRSDPPDLIVLDLMLPGTDGLEVCRRLKGEARTAHIPIVMLTARSEDADIVVGLELGADDYVTKPFSPRVLAARIKTILRRKSADPAAESEPISHQGLMIYPDRFEVRVEGKLVELTSTEFRLLELLARHPGRVFNRDQIVDAARGENYPVTDRSVDVHIVSLRRKLGRHGDLIDTVRGAGYRLRDQ